MALTAKHSPAAQQKASAVVSRLLDPQRRQPHYRRMSRTVCTARRTLLLGDLLLEDELAWLLLPSLPASTKGVLPTDIGDLPRNMREGGGRWHACRCSERRGLQPAFIVLERPGSAVCPGSHATQIPCCPLLSGLISSPAIFGEFDAQQAS